MSDPHRLAPSLLDRLIDLDPDLTRDPAITPAERPEGLRSALMRDVEALLNARCKPVSPPAGLTDLADSLVSLGVEDFLSTSLVSDMQRNAFARDLQTRLARFEPRLENLSVAILPDPIPARRSLRLRISADYRERPGLPPIIFETRVDPVAGHFRLAEASRG
jgi:type VI secretion system protein ImpF